MSSVDPPATAGQATDAPAPSNPVWHAMSSRAALAALDTRASGLTAAEADTRLNAHGPNRLAQQARRGLLARLAAQVHNLLIYVLLASAALSFLIGHASDAILILVVVVLNALIGFVQEGRAEQALAAIGQLVAPSASVRRDGHRTTVAAVDVVPGDIVLLEAGDRVPADLRLLHAHGLRIEEAALTGESMPVDKSEHAVAQDAELAERRSLAFSGTIVAAGAGAGVVVATGARTELGRIGTLVGRVKPQSTPLVRQMDHFARQVTGAILVVSLLVFAIATLVRGYSFGDAFMAVVALAVAAIPEGLPAVMSITLAVGVQRMARRNAIIRNLPTVEALGSVSTICSDKTGTLTRNEMRVRAVRTGSGLLDLDAARPVEEARHDVDDEALAVLRAAVLCNDAALRDDDEGMRVLGDPMEGALLIAASGLGLDVAAEREGAQRLHEIPFDAAHRFMATLHARAGGAPTMIVKGAPERVLAMCDDMGENIGEDGDDGSDAIGPWLRAVDEMTAAGQRVIAVAMRPIPAGTERIGMHDTTGGLRLLGLVGFVDPPRPEARAAVSECRAAGIRIAMITGDHVGTASAIARELALADEPRATTGRELDAAGTQEFARLARESTVFARTSPEHKLRLVEALQADGEVVAMTGDGVNDAPALRRADVGVAMGGKGTEAAKQASAMVLADDDFASIVAAVREGRTVYDNLVKVIAWTLPTSTGAALTIVLAVLFGLALPVTPAQILWVNMVTTVSLGLTFAFEPTEPGTMNRPPRRADERLLSGRLAWRIALVAMSMVAGAFGIQAWALSNGLPVETARTMVVGALVSMSIFYLFSVRYVHESSLTWRGALGTPAVFLGLTVVVLGQAAFTYWGPMQGVFDTRALDAMEVGAVVGVGVMLLVVSEVEKRIARQWSIVR